MKNVFRLTALFILLSSISNLYAHEELSIDQVGEIKVYSIECDQGEMEEGEDYPTLLTAYYQMAKENEIFPSSFELYSNFSSSKKCSDFKVLIEKSETGNIKVKLHRSVKNIFEKLTAGSRDICLQTLVEEVKSSIDGIDFSNGQYLSLGPVSMNKCL